MLRVPALRPQLFRYYASKPFPKSKLPNRRNMQPVTLPKFVTVAHLATLLKVRFVDLQTKMEALGFASNHSDHIIDDEDALIVAEELNVLAQISTDHGKDLYHEPLPDNLSAYPERPAVIALMGHVDHGKTTVLDYFRSSQIVKGEKGGITQHIGAFGSYLPSNKRKVCFLDTPGHEAFLKLRQRGANATDIVLLIVAADDGVMPQTKEAITHATAAGVPMVVAITKIDRAEADIPQAINSLIAAGIHVEEVGGDVQGVKVSVPARLGLEELDGALNALIDVLDLRAPTSGKVEAVVVESEQVKGLGPAATVIVKRGTLKPKTNLVAGISRCTVRQLLDERSKPLKAAGPGTPVRITGWKTLPEPGETVLEAPDEAYAKEVVANRERLLEEASEARHIKVVNENRQQDIERLKVAAVSEERARLGLITLDTQDNQDQHGAQVVPLLVKADVGGSAEAVADSINALGNDEISAKVVSTAVGPLSEKDIFFAETAGAEIIVFNTQVSRQMERLASQHKVSIHKFDVIYKAIEHVNQVLSSKLPPIITKNVLGRAEVRQVFKITVKKNLLNIAGVKVVKGTFTPKNSVRVLRGKVTVFDGKLASILHGKDTVQEAHKNSEYGMSFEEWNSVQEGDVIESYVTVSKPQVL